MQCVNNLRSAYNWFLWELWPSLYWRRCHSLEHLFIYLLRSAKWGVITGFRLDNRLLMYESPRVWNWKAKWLHAIVCLIKTPNMLLKIFFFLVIAFRFYLRDRALRSDHSRAMLDNTPDRNFRRYLTFSEKAMRQILNGKWLHSQCSGFWLGSDKHLL